MPDDTNEVVMLGNSLTRNFEWQEIFKNVNIKNRGINGDRTRGVLQRIDEVVGGKPKKVFIEIGINDLLLGLQVDSVFSNYTKIIQAIKLKSPATRIYVQSLLPANLNIYNSDVLVIDRSIELNKKLKEYAAGNGLSYIDLFPEFVSGERLNPLYDSGDGIHLSAEGYLLWSKLIASYINE